MRIEIEVPASSANLGVGFDCLALALDMYLRIIVARAESGQSSMSVEGEGAGRLRLDDSNRFLAGFKAGWLLLSSEPEPAIELAMNNPIPLKRGLGSSAAATVAGLLAVEALSGGQLILEDAARLAYEIEGHADNTAAAIFGGFVVVSEGRVARLDPPPELRAVLLIPDREMGTDEMRTVLPKTVEHGDATHNLGAAALLVAGFATRDLGLLSAMNDDRLHEPYRSRVFPELPELKQAALDAGALGAAMSGAGSTVIGLAEEDRADEVARALEETAARLDLAGRTLVVAPTTRGARLL